MELNENGERMKNSFLESEGWEVMETNGIEWQGIEINESFSK